jgi:alkyldihydroxyacetonephosphate synthase
MRTLMQDGAAPFALRLYDPVDTRIAGKGTATRARGGADWLRGALAAVDRVPALRRNALALPLALPGLLNRIARGVSSGCVLIVGWEGDDAASAADAGEARLRAAGGAALGSEVGEHWYAHRHDVSYKLAPIFARGGYADTMEVAASWSGLGALYREVSAALARHALVMAHFSHAYREGCSIYFTFAGRGTPEAHAAAWEDALEAAARAGGTVAHHHGVGTLKQRAAAVEMAAFATDYRRLSASLDPARVLNPGRLFPEVTVADAVEPAGPSIDAVSRTATLRGDQPGPERDAWLAGQGWALVYPTSGPVTDAIRGPRAPNASRILGGTVRVAGGVRAMPVAPRSSAGPDLRGDLPREAYLWVVVPVERVG